MLNIGRRVALAHSILAGGVVDRSEYAVSRSADYRPFGVGQPCNIQILGTYFFKKGWSAGAKISAIGGAPYIHMI